MSNKAYFYDLINQKHLPIFGNYYLYEDNNFLCGLMIIAKTSTELYFVKFMELQENDRDFKSYVQGNLQDLNENFDWISTKYLFQFLDEVLTKKVVVQPIDSLTAIVNQPSSKDQLDIFKIEGSNFKNVAFIKEMPKVDDLEMVSKILHQNQTNQLEQSLVDDLIDSQVYLLDVLYDN